MATTAEPVKTRRPAQVRESCIKCLAKCTRKTTHYIKRVSKKQSKDIVLSIEHRFKWKLENEWKSWGRRKKLWKIIKVRLSDVIKCLS